MRGQKVCKECGQPTGPRTKICPGCQAPFVKIKVKKKVNKSGRGYKKCPSCKEKMGVRTRECECGYKFVFTPSFLKPKQGEEVNWKELKKGDVIKVVQGSGTIWPSDRIEIEDVYFGYSGSFRVKEVIRDGILAYPVKASEGGICHIYCGPAKDCKSTGLYKRPHKIRKLQ